MDIWLKSRLIFFFHAVNITPTDKNVKRSGFFWLGNKTTWQFVQNIGKNQNDPRISSMRCIHSESVVSTRFRYNWNLIDSLIFPLYLSLLLFDSFHSSAELHHTLFYCVTSNWLFIFFSPRYLSITIHSLNKCVLFVNIVKLTLCVQYTLHAFNQFFFLFSFSCLDIHTTFYLSLKRREKNHKN